MTVEDSFPRLLSAAERAVLDCLLALDFPGGPALRMQLPHTRVVGRCKCGCATVDLMVRRHRAPPAEALHGLIPAEGILLDDQRQPRGGVIVFLDGGYLSLLEVFSFEDEPIREWPPVDYLDVALTVPCPPPPQRGSATR